MIDLALAAHPSPTLIASIIGAVGAVISAVILGYVALRAQSAKAQLQEIRTLLDDALDEFEERVTAEIRQLLDARTRALVIADALREVLSERAGGRRAYDPPLDKPRTKRPR